MKAADGEMAVVKLGRQRKRIADACENAQEYFAFVPTVSFFVKGEKYRLDLLGENAVILW